MLKRFLKRFDQSNARRNAHSTGYVDATRPVSKDTVSSAAYNQINDVQDTQDNYVKQALNSKFFLRAHKFWIDRKYINKLFFLAFLFILDFIVITALINSQYFVPVNIETGSVVFSRVFVILGLLDFMLVLVISMILLICQFIKYIKSLKTKNEFTLIIYIGIYAILSYFIWLLVIYNVIVYTIVLSVLLVLLIFLIYLCYNSKHRV